MTTVSGVVRDTQQNPLAGLQVTISYLRPLVGSSGGAAVENTRVFITDGGGLLTMAGLLPGRYSISISVPVNSLTAQPIVLRAGTLTVLDQATQTLESALDENVDVITPTILQQALDARDEAEAAASDASQSKIEAAQSAANALVSEQNALAISISGLPSLEGKNGYVLSVTQDGTTVEWAPPQMGAAETFILSM